MEKYFWISILRFLMNACNPTSVNLENERCQRAERFFRGIFGCNPSVVDDQATEDVAISYPIFAKLFNAPVIRGRKAVKGFATGFFSRWTNDESEYLQGYRWRQSKEHVILLYVDSDPFKNVVGDDYEKRSYKADLSKTTDRWNTFIGSQAGHDFQFEYNNVLHNSQPNHPEDYGGWSAVARSTTLFT